MMQINAPCYTAKTSRSKSKICERVLFWNYQSWKVDFKLAICPFTYNQFHVFPWS